MIAVTPSQFAAGWQHYLNTSWAAARASYRAHETRCVRDGDPADGWFRCRSTIIRRSTGATVCVEVVLAGGTGSYILWGSAKTVTCRSV